MNEITAKKVGEALAFSRFMHGLILDSNDVLTTLFSSDQIDALTLRITKHLEGFTHFYESHNKLSLLEMGEKKVDSDVSRLKEIYLTEDKNSDNVFDFFVLISGMSLAKWNIVKAIIESLEEDKMLDLAYDSIALHESLYDNVVSKLADIARGQVA